MREDGWPQIGQGKISCVQCVTASSRRPGRQPTLFEHMVIRMNTRVAAAKQDFVLRDFSNPRISFFAECDCVPYPSISLKCTSLRSGVATLDFILKHELLTLFALCTAEFDLEMLDLSLWIRQNLESFLRKGRTTFPAVALEPAHSRLRQDRR